MEFIKVKTSILSPPKADIYKLIDNHLPKLKEGDVLCIASKILAIHQGRCIKITPDINKDKLILQEAERYIPKPKNHQFILTIKNSTIIPSSGIDESNGNGYYILWPKNTEKLTKEICQYLKTKHQLKKLAVIATDSRINPLRHGTVGTSIGFHGLEPLHDYKNQTDIFGRTLKYTQSNIADALSATAVLLMGEGQEQVPIIIIRNAAFINFTDKPTFKKMTINPDHDLFGPLIKHFRRKNNGKNNRSSSNQH